MKADVNVADVSWCVLVNVITNRLVPPAEIVDGVKVLPTVGRLGVMVSVSAAVHVPEAHPAPVFVTPEGTDIAAVLVTCVCASAPLWIKNRQPQATRKRFSNPEALLRFSSEQRRLDALLRFFKNVYLNIFLIQNSNTKVYLIFQINPHSLNILHA